ncbi:alpha-ribazole phosphatase [Anaerovirgula multivorans]|uniref:phosphoglycerate mutase (2,3-diphosphoglycerate-dependent) n=1 Tax=Anaerovirgula multivorans TaxID=312168 RepID=A0A239H921_9FIRM|nr:histidine phosphatase family protein [Anaerovirgula multivorans]SNS76754.1 alpha-ribazole phosphatase [Anaerovirgula multivorans]
MTKLYLVRHGETNENRNSRFCGWIDVPLNDTGMAQAQKLEEAFENITIDVMYTSSLKRAKETAAFIKGNLQCPMHHIENLRELHFGRAEGLTIDEIKKCHPEVYEGLEKEYTKAKFPDGESLEDMHLRVTSTVDEILQQHIGKSILIVAHSGVIRSTVAHLITGNMKYHWNFKIDHCSITIIEKQGDFSVLTKLNDTSHLTNVEQAKEGNKDEGQFVL